MKEIIVASTNEGKIKEIKAMLEEIGIEVKSLKDVFDQDIDIEENGYKPYFTEHIEHCISNHSTFRTKELAQSYINKFLQNCRPVKVKIEVVGEDDGN